MIKIKKMVIPLIFLILVTGLIIPSVSADYWSGYQPSLNTSMWRDMTNNITNIRDNMIPSNLSLAIAASSANITALSGNSTIVMTNASATPWINLTTTYSPLTVLQGQSLNFTTAGTGSYFITVNIRENTTVTSPTLSGFTNYALCDGSGSTIVPNSERMGSRIQDVNNFSAVARTFSWIYTNSTGSTTVSVCGKISAIPSGRYAVASDIDGRSILNYFKLA